MLSMLKKNVVIHIAVSPILLILKLVLHSLQFLFKATMPLKIFPLEHLGQLPKNRGASRLHLHTILTSPPIN